MGIKTAPSLASQISLSAYQSDDSCPQSPHKIIDGMETSIVMLPVVVPTAGVTLDKPSPTGSLRSAVHLRHDSVSSYKTASSFKGSPTFKASPSFKPTPARDLAELEVIFEEPLMLHIRAGGDVREVASMAACLTDNPELQLRAMRHAIRGGNPYMVKALLACGVKPEQAVKACATEAPVKDMQAILHLIDTRNPGRGAWLDALFTSAGECKLRPFVDLLKFVKPARRELFNNETSILHIAADTGSFDAVCELLPRNLSPFACNEKGETPFDLAVKGDHALVVKAFVENPRYKAQMKFKMLDNYLTAAVHNGALGAAEMLMHAGARADRTHVSVACKRFEDEMVEALEKNIAAQPVKVSAFAKLRSLRLRKQPVMLSWHDLVDGPNMDGPKLMA